MRHFCSLLFVLLLAAGPVFGQGLPTGTVSGRVTSEGQPVAAATVTVTSSSLMGRRSAITNANGDYSIPLLPPGDYQVRVEMAGFLPSEIEAKVNAAQITSLDMVLPPPGVSIEDHIVVEAQGTLSAHAEAQSTHPQALIESLPVSRDVRQATLLTAGVTDSGPGGGLVISGARSFESLFLVNGVVVNENLRGQPLDLFIEDAIEETTTSVSGISAEYGRFAGGVVNTITKSGGNEISGSLRSSFTNDKWMGRTPLTTAERVDDVNSRLEGTLGGFLLKDRLWFFFAGRQFETEASAQTALTQVAYTTFDEELRSEGKLTFSPSEGQRLVGSYIRIDRTNNGFNFQGLALDRESLDDRKLPQDLLALNYSGVITGNLFVEGQYSERHLAFEGSGSDFTDRIRGTWIQDVTGLRYNSPTFCGVCPDEERDNENILAKASWFLSTGNLGSHEVAFGVDSFDDIVVSDNYQSGSNFSVFATDTIRQDGGLFPVFANDGSTAIVYWPIRQTSRGTDFTTQSLYVNDRWRLNDRWSFNVGARYDRNDGRDAEGKQVADDSRVSPRLGASYDLRGDGDWIVNLSYGHYVTALANNIADSTSSAGVPSIFAWFYSGPGINTGGGPLVSTHDALAQLFAWFDGSGGVDGNVEDLFLVDIPGSSTVIEGSLASPYAEEITLGISKRLGTKGIFRADLVDRRFADFYSSRTDLSTGRITLPNGVLADRSVLENDSDVLERRYRGLHTQLQIRPWERLNLGAVYTLSKTEGNVNGEAGGSGPLVSGVRDYPEYQDPRWSAPKGDLATDQRHRLRAWGVWDAWRTDRHQLSVGLLQTYTSGTPYGAVGFVDPKDPDGVFGIPNPGYASANTPVNVPYFYTARDAFRTDDVTQTDLTLNYAWSFSALGQRIEAFLQPEVLNVFGEKAVVGVDTTVLDATSSGLARFNPFTDTPVEGVHWQKGENFGKPLSPANYQTPRTFRFSVGLRF